MDIVYIPIAIWENIIHFHLAEWQIACQSSEKWMSGVLNYNAWHKYN